MAIFLSCSQLRSADSQANASFASMIPTADCPLLAPVARFRGAAAHSQDNRIFSNTCGGDRSGIDRSMFVNTASFARL
ncbi:hypothetical protein AB4Z34_11720 [Ensifer sp. 2YAB10]|jgi:hypothetical protein|uniref:hypothetical protein n=1 Tax=unclassified Ensifer TaxID=2633371 RepID=UPI0013B0088F|nr:hypothetical protein [Ensifer sp. SSB1]MBK5565954.1 hypothetical protein [Ensifer sp. SSB1]